MTGPVRIRPMHADDWADVEAIYRAGIATGNAMFEAEPPTWEQFNAGKLDVGRLIATSDSGCVLGWIAASPLSARPIYAGVVEHSVYVDPAAAGHGIGSQLVTALISATADADIWTIQSNVFPENLASLALHDRAGFRRIGSRERIAFMTYGPWAGQWRDTILIEHRRN
ncbi:N-acetyltransferase [Subtercola boreus]|uniref:N-acetyltransferase n=1 Tax=Subtercola boreus TaxID=120213 RepID=A0A3E0V9M7_9MICO|nr:GNAT family N-acetyltransferase [Subtercola boreus]RFA06462.1 N-acetyltransferase [Subtercola boreus]TQL46909.1 phosphinothricin acetyltransferase [Subtercola boreus]